MVIFALQMIFWLLPKLYFDFVKVIFRLLAEVTVFIHNFPQGKYHCNAISLRKQYHCRRQSHYESNFPKVDKLLDIVGFFGYTRFAS